LAGRPQAEIDAKVASAARILNIEHLLQRKPKELSGGQRQRVALARAIVRRPEVFLMDEPLSNLDAKLRTQTRLELVELHRRLGTTFVYVTHDQVEAMTMADRIAIISDGRLQQVGPPQDVYERPANLFVAGFIGSPPMNTMSGRLSVTDAGTLVTTSAGTLRLQDPPEGADDGREVVVGVRPEHLAVGPDTPSALRATVDNVELLGHERHLLCHTDDARLVVRQTIEDDPVTVGATVSLVAEPGGLHLFDPTTTGRLG
jgi:multiple sugar transport system ATP-binding protein